MNLAKLKTVATETKAQSEEKPPVRPAPSFWDSWPALILMVVAIIGGRIYILEPFKIPSGSMEPTLFGHEDYGDRILTNKLAFVTAAQAGLIIAGSIVVIAIGFVASKAWQRWRSIVSFSLLSILVVGGILLAWSRGAVAGEPKRFDVVVFQYETEWSDSSGPGGSVKRGDANKKINYIKRLVGLPGETIVVSSGDLYKRDKFGQADHIIRKWETSDELQDALWYPVAKCWRHDSRELLPADRSQAEFPWLVAPERSEGGSGTENAGAAAQVTDSSLELSGEGKVELAYKHPVQNVYLKQGRWPYRHDGCPEANKPGVGGFRNPDNKSEYIEAYVANTWEGVQCPQCRQLLFPIVRDPQAGAQIYPNEGKTRFFYGGDKTVNDLKLEVELEIEKPGTLELETGSSLHSAHWRLGAPAIAESATVHPVNVNTPALTAGRHTLTLAFVDGTVIAALDGAEIERRKIEIKPTTGRTAIKSIARLNFDGLKGRVTKLNLYRDLFYTPLLFQGDPGNISARQANLRRIEHDNYIAEIPQDHFFMLGDNAPGSADGRLWGFVPRENLSGRAWVIWWPPSRWRVIR